MKERSSLATTDPSALSPIGHLFIGHVMPLVLHYPERLEAQRLVASLEEVLKAVPLLTGDLGAWLDREVDPRLLYKQKTIDSLADYVAQNHATMPPRRKK